jgi:putative intracellular protease/amidase
MTSFAHHTGARVVIVAQNAGTEITDLLVPFAILSEAGLDVEILSMTKGPVNLMNGLRLEGLRSIEEHGNAKVDLVVIPAVHNPEDRKLIEWLSQAHDSGSTLASICDGAEVLAATGLLKGHRATGHFYSKKRRESNFPDVDWIKDVRYVHDRRMVTTAGVSASAPATIYLVETLVDKATANTVAERYGIDRVDASVHDSSEFSIGMREVLTGAQNYVYAIRKKKYNLITTEGVDEFNLALVTDALGRTYRTSIALDTGTAEIRTRHGLIIRGTPPHEAPDWVVHLNPDPMLPIKGNMIVIDRPQHTIATIFKHIETEFGQRTADFVAMQLELPSGSW